ncbi:MAG: fructosamine kinase family protein [Sandaracinus sp.]|nr:fructosamine kinase family protein [Sandaracinus sp.]
MSLDAALARTFGASPRDRTRVSGGDIHEAWRVTLADGRVVFVKTHPRPPRGVYEAEADGLSFLAEGPLRVPRVLAAEPSFLALEWLEPARRVADFDERLGRGLAALHRAQPACFGHVRDNFLGPLPQPNEPADDWPTFYAERRLAPMLARSRADASLRRRFDRLYARLPELCGPPEPPARLHGDLWGGNLHVDERGEPALIDPAVYGGHREIDLAMMRLFGGFSSRVFAAYEEVHPLAPGHEERVALYQLYPLLVHAVLFGGGYLSRVASIVDTLV